MAESVRPDRSQVVQRAVDYFDRIAYIWGGFPGTNTRCWCMNDNTTQTSPDGHGGVNSGPYIASDCSGYVSWCWFKRSHVGTGYWISSVGRYHPRATNGNTFEESFPGIQPGDAVIRERYYVNPVTGYPYNSSGHIGIYVGNNTILHCSSNHWQGTTSKHGMSRTQGDKSVCAGYQGYTSWDDTEGTPYDPDDVDDPVNDWNNTDGLPGEPTTPNKFMDSGAFLPWVYNQQYIKKYKKMKHYRLF